MKNVLQIFLICLLILCCCESSFLNAAPKSSATPKPIIAKKPAVRKLSEKEAIQHLQKLGSGFRRANNKIFDVTIRRSVMSDADIDILCTLQNIQRVKFFACNKITNTGINKLIEKLPNLQYLSVTKCDQFIGLEIGGAKKLLWLEISGCQKLVVCEIINCPKLKTLLFSGDALEEFELHNLPNVDNVRLRWCPKLAPRSFFALQPLPKLSRLTLWNWKNLTDKKIGYLNRLESLTYLKLEACNNVTAEGLAQLVALKKLRSIEVEDCEKITSKGVAKLRKKLPKWGVKIPLSDKMFFNAPINKKEKRQLKEELQMKIRIINQTSPIQPIKK